MNETEAHLTILGGGPAGLAVAYYTHQQGLPFQLFEKTDQLGGLCQTLRCGQHAYDSGAHRFHDRDAAITADVRELLGARLRSVRAPSKVYVERRFFDFPPRPLDALFSSGPARIVRIGLDLIRARTNPKTVHSFADHATNLFGETLARTFLLNYSEKLWGLPAEELSPDVATRRLSGMHLRVLLMELLFPGRTMAHIDGAFLYPRGGYGEICQALTRKLPPSSVHLNHAVDGIDCQDQRIEQIRFQTGDSFRPPGMVVSTLPLTLLVSLLGEAGPAVAQEASRELHFRHIRLLFLRLAQQKVSDNASIYLPDSRLCVSRIYEPKNRSSEMAPPHETSIVAEVPCSDGEEIFHWSDQELADQVIQDLTGIGILEPNRILEWRHHLLPNAYPVYSLNYVTQVGIIRDALKHLDNLRLLGRGGRFFYSHLHDQLRMAKDFIQDLTGDR